jgi:hypothetical protein
VFWCETFFSKALVKLSQKHHDAIPLRPLPWQRQRQQATRPPSESPVKPPAPQLPRPGAGAKVTKPAAADSFNMADGLVMLATHLMLRL